MRSEALARLTVVALVAVCGVTVAPVIASSSPDSPGAAKAVKAQAHTLVGTVVVIDEAAQRVSVKADDPDGSRELLLILEKDHRIVVRGRRVPLADLRPGDRVLAHCSHHRADRHRVRIVKVVSPRTGARSEAPGEP